MAGAKWHRIPAIPRAIPKSKRTGKKTSGRSGDRAEIRGSAGTTSADHVPRRGALRPDGSDSALLGTRTIASQSRKRLRTTICLRLRCGQSSAGRIGLEDLLKDEHRRDE